MTKTGISNKSSIMQRYEDRRHCSNCGGINIREIIEAGTDKFVCCNCGCVGTSKQFEIRPVEVGDPNIVFLFKVKDFLDNHNLVIDEATLGVEHDYKYDKLLRVDIITGTRTNIQLKVKTKEKQCNG